MKETFISFNKWLVKQCEDGIFQDIINISKIPNIEFIDSNANYVLYHLYLLESSTVNQLSDITGLSVREVRNSIKKLSSKELLKSHRTILYGSPIKVYQLNREGLETVMSVYDLDQLSERKRIKQKVMNHFVESNFLFVSMYRFVSNILMEKEKNLNLRNGDTLRTDVSIYIEYSNENVEKLLLEHDRGTERMDVIEKKLHQYSIAMSLYEISNISFSVSYEHMVKKAIANQIWKTPEIISLENKIKLIKAITNCLKQLNCNTMLDFVQLMNEYTVMKEKFESGECLEKNVEDKINDYSFLYDFNDLISKNNAICSKNTNNSTTISELRRILIDDLESEIRKVYFSLLNKIIKKRETRRCELIKKRVMQQEDYIEVTNKEANKFSFDVYSKVIKDRIGPSIKSFKYQLLQHECVILPMEEMKLYYEWKIQLNTYLFKSLTNYFPLKKSEYEFQASPIVIYTLETKIVKKENSFIFMKNNQVFGLILFDSQRILSDEIKLNEISEKEEELSIDLAAVYWVDIRDCKWNPTSNITLKEVHEKWRKNIHLIVNKR